MEEDEEEEEEVADTADREMAAWQKERNEDDGDGEFGDGERVKRRKERVAGRDERRGAIVGAVVVSERYEAEATRVRSGSRFYESQGGRRGWRRQRRR